MRGFIKFIKGVLRMRLPIKAWTALLLIMNLVAPLFFIRHLESQVVFGTTLVSAATMVWLTGRFGFTRIVGAGHFYWFPMLAWLWTRLGQHDLSEPFGVWLIALMVVNSISLIVDVVDVVRYAAGDRKEVVPGL